jgi:serine phosphatase RsbU (regulator of sigma subunit)
LTLALTMLIVGCGFALYRAGGLLFDAASLAAEVNLLAISLSLSGFIETDRRKRLAEQQLQLEREAAARVAGELEAARRIQMGSLPLAAAVFPGETRFEIDALLKPARQVGGDLYDFFMLDENRVFLIIGDVSGKGLPACLFMVMIKTLAKSIILGGKEDLRATMNRINREMARDNPETLFVTAFAAVFDAASGILDYGIAGHDAPWRISASGGMSSLAGEGNLPLCAEEGWDYPVFRLELAPGDTICVVTDGVTEAMNTAKELYGKGRLERLLTAEASSLSPAELIARVHGDVLAFTVDAEQSDDLAILALRWRGGGEVNAR